jgi:tRNA(Arg) A34 adenosine deaminase TadA
MTSHEILDLAIKKASQSTCTYKVSAIGINHKGEVIGTARNTHRFLREGGSDHAEANLIKRYRGHLKTIIICRIGNGGVLLPIDPCCSCEKLANKYGIKIVSIA